LRRELLRQYFAALARNTEGRTEDRLPSCRAKADQQLRFYQGQLRLKPRAAGCDFARIRFLMNSTFAARLPLKMLHRVRDVNLAAIDSSFFERAVHDRSRGSNKRSAGNILVIARLFADEHDRCAPWSFAKNSLRRALVNRTRCAFTRSFADFC